MTKPGPGRYEGNESLELSQILDQTPPDDSFGDSSSGNGWVGLIKLPMDLEGIPSELIKPAFVVTEDTNGFFDYVGYDTIEEAEAKFEAMRPVYEVEEEAV